MADEGQGLGRNLEGSRDFRNVGLTGSSRAKQQQQKSHLKVYIGNVSKPIPGSSGLCDRMKAQTLQVLVISSKPCRS